MKFTWFHRMGEVVERATPRIPKKAMARRSSFPASVPRRPIHPTIGRTTMTVANATTTSTHPNPARMPALIAASRLKRPKTNQVR